MLTKILSFTKSTFRLSMPCHINMNNCRHFMKSLKNRTYCVIQNRKNLFSARKNFIVFSFYYIKRILYKMEKNGVNSVDKCQTLLRYNTPVLVDKCIENKSSPKTVSKQSEIADGTLKSEIEEALKTIFPPLQWEIDGKTWQQTVSSTPATSEDVMALQQILDSRLKEKQARDVGICPMRHEIYSQCFDEIIRQVTINCPERGLLMFRIRDEIAMSLDAYVKMYCRAVAFGMRTALEKNAEKETLRDNISTLEAEKDALEQIIDDMQTKKAESERRSEELRAAESKKYAEEIALLKKVNSQIEAQLENFAAAKKSD